MPPSSMRRGTRGHAGAQLPLRHAGDRGRQPEQRFRHARRRRTCHEARDAGATPSASTTGWSMPASGRMRRPSLIEPEQLHVAIIGAGATGVELAAELHRTTREVVAYGLDRIDPDKDIRLNLIEAADRVLPALPERLSQGHARPADAARRACAHLGTGSGDPGRAASVWPTVAPSVRNWSSGRPASRRPISSAGPGRARDQPHQPARRARRRCRPRATTTFSPSATVPPVPGRKTARWVPPRAQAAHQQASHMVRPDQAAACRRSR